jgi:ribosomal protein S18 acetylase RimI-like enzyme
MTVKILFAGDRISDCDEGIIMQDQEKFMGLATIAPRGENQSGQPTIVGLYVAPECRKRDYGRQLLQKAITRCLERGFQNIRMDVMSSAAKKIILELPTAIRAKLDVHDCGSLLDELK